MSFDREFTERVKQFYNIGQVISEHVELKQKGRDYVGKCPFCHNDKKTFSVSAKKRIFKCFACGEGGDVIKFLKLFQNRKFPELLEDLAKKAGIVVPEQISWKAEKRKSQKRASEAKSSVVTAESSTPIANDGVQDNSLVGVLSEADTKASPKGSVTAGDSPGYSDEEIEAMAKQMVVASGDGTVLPEEAKPSDKDNQSEPSPSASENQENTLMRINNIRVLPDLPVEPWARPVQLVNEFYQKLTLHGQDEKGLFDRRGLESKTSRSLGFRSNPRANAALLSGLEDGYSWRDQIDSGLFNRNRDGNGTRRSRQFFGWGIAGKEVIDGKKVTKWDWTYPILIPYFDGAGRLVGLRPHKGGCRRTQFARSRLYVPRLEGVGTNRTYRTVLITESEFKCAAAWQMLGGGSCLPDEQMVGVCGLPGIQQFKNPFISGELQSFLHETNPRRVVVIFDSEEKGDPHLPGYNQIFEKRFDSLLYAGALAKQLSKWFAFMKVELGELPEEWRDERGKADWDGCLSRINGGQIELVS